MENITLDISHFDEMTEMGFSKTFLRRLTDKLQRRPSGCLEFTGAKLTFGYGHMSRGSRGAGFQTTHAVAWMLANGPIPDGFLLCHTCDNPPCCEVAHLFLGTQADNIHDMWSKGRQRGQIPAGEAHPSAKLSDAQVVALRALHETIPNHAELGRRFGISKQYARSLVLGRGRKQPT